MRGSAVAGWVRGRGLLRRRLGADGAARLARSDGLASALDQLSSTTYGPAVRSGMHLEQAQRAVQSVLLWHMRILAGWGPASGVNPMRTLAGGFEIANVVGHLVSLEGGPTAPPYELGSLSTAWGAVRAASGPAGVRAALSRSGWGDPSGDDPGTVLLAMRMSWARRIVDEVPPAAPWARSAATLVWSGLVSEGISGELNPGLARLFQAVLGLHFQDQAVPDRPVPDRDPRWAEADWWLQVEGQSRSLLAHGTPGIDTTVAVIGLLAADAWRVNAALAMAGHMESGGYTAGLFDAVA